MCDACCFLSPTCSGLVVEAGGFIVSALIKYSSVSDPDRLMFTTKIYLRANDSLLLQKFIVGSAKLLKVNNERVGRDFLLDLLAYAGNALILLPVTQYQMK